MSEIKFDGKKLPMEGKVTGGTRNASRVATRALLGPLFDALLIPKEKLTKFNFDPHECVRLLLAGVSSLHDETKRLKDALSRVEKSLDELRGAKDDLFRR